MLAVQRVLLWYRVSLRVRVRVRVSVSVSVRVRVRVRVRALCWLACAPG